MQIAYFLFTKIKKLSFFLRFVDKDLIANMFTIYICYKKKNKQTYAKKKDTKLTKERREHSLDK